MGLNRMWYVYIILCKGDRLYTGITNDLGRRMVQHKCGKGARFTRAFPPKELIYFERCINRSEASVMEYELKQLTKQDKLLIASQLETFEVAILKEINKIF